MQTHDLQHGLWLPNMATITEHPQLPDMGILPIIEIDQHNRNTAWLRDTVTQPSQGKSGAAGRSALAADFPGDVCLTISWNHGVFFLSSTKI